jgi:uncharacterized protein (TIGR02145 family)
LTALLKLTAMKKPGILIMVLFTILFIWACKKEGKKPTLTTNEISDIAQKTATCGGNISSDGGSTVNIQGVCWNTAENPTTEDHTTISGMVTALYTCFLTGLVPNTTYFVRAYATNENGTGYGNNMSFKTLQALTDKDGNFYDTLTIGTQSWMTENLKTSRYNDSTLIPHVTENTEWIDLITPGFCWYENNFNNKAIYGNLYNWYTVATTKLCPSGWHVPSDAEWLTLIDYLGGESVAGGKLKEIGNSHWISPNTGATNESGFTSLPSGNRIGADGSFFNVGG